MMTMAEYVGQSCLEELDRGDERDFFPQLLRDGHAHRHDRSGRPSDLDLHHRTIDLCDAFGRKVKQSSWEPG